GARGELAGMRLRRFGQPWRGKTEMHLLPVFRECARLASRSQFCFSSGPNVEGPDSMEAVPQKTTIRDVARAAGVGVGTISRELNSSSQVSRETRARVLKANRRLRFRPNAQTRRLLKPRSHTACLL